MLEVFVMNDDVTGMGFVVDLLQSIFEKSFDEAERIMVKTHQEGRASCGVYPQAQARDLVSRALAFAQQAGEPLQFSVADAP